MVESTQFFTSKSSKWIIFPGGKLQIKKHVSNHHEFENLVVNWPGSTFKVQARCKSDPWALCNEQLYPSWTWSEARTPSINVVFLVPNECQKKEMKDWYDEVGVFWWIFFWLPGGTGFFLGFFKFFVVSGCFGGGGIGSTLPWRCTDGVYRIDHIMTGQHPPNVPPGLRP